MFNADDAETMNTAGHSVILVRRETSPEDVKGMYSSEGVVTQLGGMTSHAAVVARGWGKTCITGCSELQVSQFSFFSSQKPHLAVAMNNIVMSGLLGLVMTTCHTTLCTNCQVWFDWAGNVN